MKPAMRRRGVAPAAMILAACGLAIGSAGAAPQAAPPAAAAQYYRADDFARVSKIDAHVHIHGRADQFMKQALADNFRIVEINVDYPDFPPLSQQQQDALSLKARYPGRVAWVGSFLVRGFQSPDWSAQAIRQIAQADAAGAVGIKVWKNIGMALRDAAGHYVMLDNPRLSPVMDYIAQHYLVLVAHQAEPLNCWLPMSRMTVRSDREYFSEHPQYYMYRHPQMPSHAAILAARDRVLAAHPDLRVDAVHLASLEWDVDRVAQFLERFPTARVDLAARLVHLEYQATRDRARVRRFLMRYRDRVLYGSDEAYGPQDDNPGAVADIHRHWVEDWRFLVTDDAMHSADFTGGFRGLRLPRDVVEQIYRRNAEALFGDGWH
ncbi:MAG: amidohydrolase family protein [Proteobacteria bacterium]|nr:amidohydrolase family protein [Pseudomonadota bacterium]